MFFLADLQDTKKVCSRGWLVRIFLLRWLSLAWHRKGGEEGGDDDKNRLSHYAECATFSLPLVSCRIGTKEKKERKSEGCCTQGDKQKAKKSPLARGALCAD